MKYFPIFSYGFLGLPLAMVALPIYVQIPNYYTTHFATPLAITGFVLFLARMFDTFQDPFFGNLLDKIKITNRWWFALSSAMLMLAFWGLWQPPTLLTSSTSYVLAWFGFMLFLAYSAHSMLNIAYIAWGSSLVEQEPARWGDRQTLLLRAASWREGFGLLGIISASIIPTLILSQPLESQATQLQLFCMTFALLLLVGVAFLLHFAPRPATGSSSNKKSQAQTTYPQKSTTLKDLQQLLREGEFRALLLIYFINSLSVAIPSNLILYFVNDRLGEREHTGMFLASYFLAGAIALPAWSALAKRIGLRNAWKLGMAMAILSFVGTCFLGQGDTEYFLIICFISGLSLGSDLALPPVLLAQTVQQENLFASYFGIWSTVGKLSVAISALSLPLLHYLHYQPQLNVALGTELGKASAAMSGNSNTFALVVAYAILPCLCKVVALVLLHKETS